MYTWWMTLLRLLRNIFWRFFVCFLLLFCGFLLLLFSFVLFCFLPPVFICIANILRQTNFNLERKQMADGMLLCFRMGPFAIWNCHCKYFLLCKGSKNFFYDLFFQKMHSFFAIFPLQDPYWKPLQFLIETENREKYVVSWYCLTLLLVIFFSSSSHKYLRKS